MKSRFALRRDKVIFLASHRHLWENVAPGDVFTLHDLARQMKQAGLYSPATKEADILPGLKKLFGEALEAEEDYSEPAKTAPCPHENWAVRSYNRLGFGQCLNCCRELPLAALFQTLANRAEALSGPAPDATSG